jgi:hypothetical protein
VDTPAHIGETLTVIALPKAVMHEGNAEGSERQYPSEYAMEVSLSFHPVETAMALLPEVSGRSPMDSSQVPQIYEWCNTPAPVYLTNRVKV